MYIYIYIHVCVCVRLCAYVIKHLHGLLGGRIDALGARGAARKPRRRQHGCRLCTTGPPVGLRRGFGFRDEGLGRLGIGLSGYDLFCQQQDVHFRASCTSSGSAVGRASASCWQILGRGYRLACLEFRVQGLGLRLSRALLRSVRSVGLGSFAASPYISVEVVGGHQKGEKFRLRMMRDRRPYKAGHTTCKISRPWPNAIRQCC